MLGFSTTIPWLLASITVAFSGVSVVRPTLTSLVTRKSGRERQGVVLGLTQSLMSISQITVPFVSGFLIQHQFLRGWTWAGVLASSVGLLLLSVPSLRSETVNW